MSSFPLSFSHGSDILVNNNKYNRNLLLHILRTSLVHSCCCLVVKSHDLLDLRVGAFCTFQLLKRKAKSQNGNAQLLLYVLSLAQSNADSRVSHANEIVGYYKKEHLKKWIQFEQKACCVCL